MAETERPHRSSSINSSSNNVNTTNGSSTDLFICFTSRFSSSSSMRLSSLSPARSACLTTSLSRRLRTSGSLKNASAGVLNSPMFGANGGRKRSGSGYENNNNNIEPSSPKVTCIGQVRVKTRKHVKKKMRARSRRKSETSFRRTSSDQNDGGSGGGGCRYDASEKRWVHLPVTICESLRAFGSELNCFLPCRSSCTDHNSHQNRDREGRRRVESNGDGCGGGNSCGAVFTRWFVAVEETGGKRREIELVVGGGEDEAEEDRRRSRRRHVFESLDISEIEMKTEKKEREDVGRINLCSPPKNALLLMRCRSDPVKVAALANRVRERQMSLNEGAYGREEEEDDERRKFELDLEDKKRIELCEKWISGETIVEREVVVPVAEAEAPAKVEETVQVVEAEDIAEERDSFEEEIEATIIKNIEDHIRNAIEEEEHMAAMEVELAAVAKEEEEEEEVDSVTPNVERSNQGNREPDPSPEVVMRGGNNQQQDETTTEKEKTTPYKVLPDCLLLMMCEPKLSMEVSKETWVCSTDFVRCLPGRPPAKKITEAAGEHHHQHHHNHHQPKKRMVAAVDSNASSRRRSIDKPPGHHALLQPPRSSCSYPAAPPIITAAAAVGEQKVGGTSKAFEPPVLPRCKSEPRKSASKLAPEACFWKNRKLEPHPPAAVGVGAAGVGKTKETHTRPPRKSPNVNEDEEPEGEPVSEDDCAVFEDGDGDCDTNVENSDGEEDNETDENGLHVEEEGSNNLGEDAREEEEEEEREGTDADSGDDIWDDELIPDPLSSDEDEEKEEERICRVNEDPDEILALGKMFNSSDDFKHAVLTYSLKTRYDVKLYRSQATKIGAKCCDTEVKCQWRVYASYEKRKHKLQIKVYEDKHTCVRTGYSKMLKVSTIAGLYAERLRMNSKITKQEMVAEIMREFNLVVTEDQCKKAKSKILKERKASHEAHFTRIWDYQAEILKTNKDTTFEIETIPGPTIGSKQRFYRLYICFSSQRESWKQTCRPIIGLDGAFLKWDIKGHLLAATGRDGDNRIVPIAWAVVEIENDPNWDWFVRHLCGSLDLGDGRNVAIISDKQKGLVKAIHNILPQTEHRQCAKHIMDNWKKDSGDVELKRLFWKIARSYTKGEYEDHLVALKRYNPQAWNSLHATNPESWSRAFFRIGSYCNDNLNNLSESFNRTIREARRKPLLELLEDIRRQCMVRNEKRSVITGRLKTRFTKRAHVEIEKMIEGAQHCIIHSARNNMHEVQQKEVTVSVDMNEQTCGCRKWQMTGIPCVHAAAVIIRKKQKIGDYVNDFYTVKRWQETYKDGIKPVEGMQLWPRLNRLPVLPPPWRNGNPGRPSNYARKRGQYEAAPSTKTKLNRAFRTMTCSNCKEEGYNKQGCKNPSVESQPKRPRGRPKNDQDGLLQGSQGQASVFSQGQGSQGQGSQGVSQGQESQRQRQGSQRQRYSSQRKGAQGQGSQGQGSQGQGAQDNGSEGQGSQGQGAQGWASWFEYSRG